MASPILVHLPHLVVVLGQIVESYILWVLLILEVHVVVFEYFVV